jgi:chemotaxis protein methyltransferase CheR
MALSTADAGYIRTLIRSRSAIVLDESKEYLIESRLSPLLKETGHTSLPSLIEAVRARPAGPLGDRIVDALTTNETSFFRDRHPFVALENSILPRIIAARAPTRRLSIWCAASSSGQEPFSLGMLLVEKFPELATWQVEIVATDISKEILARARTGTFSQVEVNRGLPAQMLAKYFQREGMTWKIAPKIRDMVSFRELNLASPWPPMGRFDVVMCRNVLIYFDVATRSEVLDKIGNVLAPDGVLMLGAAETTLNLTDRFERVQEGPCGWYELKGISR